MNAPAQLKVNPIVPVVIFVVIILLLFLRPFAIIKTGHVGVVSLFGKVDDKELPEGFHIINPLKKVTLYNCQNREITLTNVGVPSQDQLITSVDITVQWRVDTTQAAEASRDTGKIGKLETVYLMPTLRSLLREAGKKVTKAEQFYNDETQKNMQLSIREGLIPLSSKGIMIEAVLIRKVELPRTISEGVENKKRQDQLADQQEAELRRFETEQQQKIAQAKAEKNAAIQEAEKRIALADAKAYEITAEAKARAEAITIEGEALRNNSEVIKLRSVEKWNGSVPNVMLGEGAVPMINLGDVTK